MNIIPSDRIRIGSEAFRYLSAGTRRGTIVSTFFAGANARFDDGRERDPALIAFQTSLHPLHPWAVEFPTASLLTLGMRCSAENSILHLGSTEALPLSTLKVNALEVPSWRRQRAVSALARVPELEDFLEGLPTRWEDLSIDERDALIHHPPVDSIFVRYLLRRVIGRGSGSTPGGDDYIVGHLAVLWAMAGLSEHAQRQIKGIRTLWRWEKLKERTPIGSAQMILAAVDGHFPSAVCLLMIELGILARNASTQLILRALVSQGATSGMATLAGIVDGLRRAALWYPTDT